MKNKNKSIRT